MCTLIAEITNNYAFIFYNNIFLNKCLRFLTFSVCEFLCPTLISMFGPWLEPWYEGWNTDHRSLKLPWLATDMSISALMADVLVECIIFVLDTMPGYLLNNFSDYNLK